MSFSKSLLSSGILAGAVFAIASLPLVLMGPVPLTVTLGQRPVFAGQIRDLSVPYVGMTTTTSLGLGLAAFVYAGWRRSSRQLNQFEKRLSELDQQIQEKEALIEDLAFSEAKLKALGLDAFLHNGNALEPHLTPAALVRSVGNPEITPEKAFAYHRAALKASAVLHS